MLIRGDRVDSFCPPEEAGNEAGCQRFGVRPFLLKKVQRDEPVRYSTVDVIP